MVISTKVCWRVFLHEWYIFKVSPSLSVELFGVWIFQEVPQKKIFLERWGRGMSTNPLDYTFTTWHLIRFPSAMLNLVFILCISCKWQNKNMIAHKICMAMVMLATVAPTPLILFCATMFYSTFISAPSRVSGSGYSHYAMNTNIVFKATSPVLSTHR